MNSISDYKKRIGKQKNVETATVKHAKHSIKTFFRHSPSFEEVLLNNDEVKVPVQIVSDAKIPTVKTILMEPDYSIKAGHSIKRSNNEIWLCLSDDPNDVYVSGKIERCNFDLRWIDQDGFIQSFPSILYFNARSNFGTEEDKLMNLPAGRRQIVVSKNVETQLIQRDTRFIIGSEAFKVIDTDYMSDDGLVNLSLQSDQIDPVKDNLELGIADYNKLSKYELIILNDNPLSLSAHQSAKINVKVLKNGTETINPQLEYSSSNTDLVSVDEQGIVTIHESGEVTITVSAYGIEKQLNIYVAHTIHYDYDATIDGANDIYLNRESTYVASFYNNGIKISDESSFSLTNLDGSPTLLASITSQDPIANACTVKANSIRKLGTVILHVKNANGLSSGQKEIKIKSLI
ncbi:Ig-like domain-containing protein [Paenibacillus xylanexedens]|uniref:Ig-like domain-containing protein n=1 Tax=Paenibacillus xylanexedens TaxID=528191 RepID=UPI000F5470F9|nr:hypothetical protein [Paenibacillus xylanexedens]RPK31848.1 hypothetical protein EDO6_02475 [Paenibacillus xylanexedens]